MNFTYRSVWCEKTQTYVAASELAKGRTKRGKVASAAISLLLGSLVTLENSAQAAMVVNGNPQEASPSCELMSDGSGSSWTVATSANCQVGTLAGTASGQGNPGQNAVFYSSTQTNGKEDSLNLGGYLDVWKGATFHAGLDMSQQKITNLADGSAATDAATFGQLNMATRYFKAGGLNDGTDDAQAYSHGLAAGAGAFADANGGRDGASIALGAGAYAYSNASANDQTGQGWDSIAIGSHSTASGAGALALGPNANANYTNIAIGNLADASGGGRNAIAIGQGAKANAWYSVALGTTAEVSAGNSVALGFNSLADRANTVSVGRAGGERQIVNVAKGTADTDAVNLAQLKTATRYFKSGGLNDGTDDAKAETLGLAAGAGAYAASNVGATAGSVALGTGAYAYSNGSANDLTGKTWDSVAVGSNSHAGGAGALAVGPNANANYTDIAIGSYADVSGGARNSIAIGQAAKATNASNAVALGTTAEVTAANSVALGSGALADRASTVSVGKVGGERQIVNMAKGTADTDAVNVAQLKGVTTALGGGAAVNADGTIKAPSYLLANANSIAGTSGAAADAGSGFAKVDSALGALNTTANKGFNISADAGATSQNIAPGGTAKFAAGSNTSVSRSGDTITYSIVSNPTFSGVLTANGGLVVGAGKTVDMGGNKLTNVAAGSAATDGVNKAQLDALNTLVTKQGTDSATNLGGGAAYNAGTGAISAPSYLLANANSIAGTSGAAADAGSGFAKVDAALGAVNAAASHTNRYVKINGANDGTDDAYAVGNAMAIGIKAFASNYAGGAEADGLAVGESASATGVASTALGHLSSATGNNSVALGNSSVADRANTVSVGKAGAERQIANMAKGTADTDAVNVAQLKGVTTALGGGAAVNADGTLKAPSYLLANANSIAGTSGAAADAGSGFAKVDSALGKLNTSVTQNTTDIAGNTTAITNLTNNISSGKTGLVQQSAAGANLTVGKTTDGAAVDFLGTAGARKLLNVADGTVAANSKDAVNGGQLFTTNQQVAQNTSSISNLDGRVTQNTTDINTITGAVTTMGSTLADAVKYDSAAHDKVTLGNAGTPVQVTNVKAGQLNASSSDAVNGSQLYATNQQVAQNTTDIAGNTSAITNLTNNVNTGKTGLVQQSAAGANLTVGKTTDGAAVDFLGTAGARKLLNVADGTVAANSKDAVNGGQLFTTNNQVAQNTSSISNLDGRVTQNTTDISNITGAVTNMGGTLADAVKYDSAAHDKVTLGNAGTPVQVTNVKAGQLNASSSDAVNGSQLYATNQQVAQNTTDIAGNTSAITNLTNNVNTGKTGLVQQSAAGANLTVGKATDGAAVDFLGTAGARKLLNVADGTVAANSKDAVNGGQLFTTNNQVAQNTSSISNLDGRVTQNSTDISTINSTITTMGGTLTDAVKYDSATHDKVTLGNTGTPVQVTNVKAGQLSASSSDAVNGSQLYSTNQQVAQNTTDIAGNTSAITNLTNNVNTGKTGLVQQSAAGANLTVGKTTDGTAVDFLGTTGARKLINVADGNVAAGSKEAVNGGQLFGASQSMANAMGGNAVVNADGSISAPSYTVTNADGSTTKVTNVGDAISNIDGRVAQNTTDIAGNTTAITNLANSVNSGTVGMVQQSAAGANLTVGKDTDGSAVDFLGTGGARKLINVADGSVAAGSKEAVNGGQLFGVSQSMATALGGNAVVNADGSVSAPSYSVTNADGSTRTVNSIGDAISNIDGRTAQNTTDINTLNSTITTLNGVMGDVVKYDSPAHDKITLGKTGTAVQLTNLKAGELSADSSDAVNGSQLFSTNSKVAIIDGRVTNLEGNITNMISGGGVKYFHTSSAKADAIASGSDSVAIGGAAKASGDGSVALGDNAQTSAKGSVAIGQNANDNGRGAESYTGQYSGAQNDSVGTVAVGNAATGETRTISGVADARQATDAVNLRQLDGAVAESKSYTDSKVSQANGQITDSIEKIDTRVTKVEGDVGNLQNGTDGMAQVNNASRLPKPKATGADSSAFGAGSEASGDNSIAMGTNAKAKGKNSAAIGANSVADRDNTVSMGSAGNERQITHVAAGVENTDAVNVGQMNDALGSVASQSNRQYNALKRDLEKQNDDLSAGIAGAIAIASLPQPMVNGGSTTSAGLGTYNGQSALSVGVAHVSNDGKWISKLGGSTDTQGHFSAGVSLGYNW